MHAPTQQSMILRVVQSLIEFGMNTPDMTQAESCLFQVCSLLRSMAENDATTKLPHNQLEASAAFLQQLYLRARLRLGQIAAWNGRLAEAYDIFSEIVRSADSGVVTMQAVAWYDLGVLFLASNQPDHALQAFQQSVTTSSTEHQRQGFCGMDADHVMSRFLPGALSQLERLMDCLEGQRTPSAEDSFCWSIELMFPGELKQSSSRRMQTDVDPWTAGAA